MFNKLTLKNTVIISIIIALFLTFNAYIKKHDIIKNQEKKLNIFNKIKLYAIRMIHYFVFFCLLFFPFLTKVSVLNDIVFICLFVTLQIHWITYSECVLTITEKQILDPSYVPGSNKSYEPFLSLINDDSEKFTGMIQLIAGFFCPLIIFLRVLT